MKLSEFIQKISRDFLIIFAAIIIMITILLQLSNPDMALDLQSVYTIMGFSLISAFLGFILYSSRDLNEKEMRIRIIVHFLALEILLIVLASFFGIVNSAVEAIILALQIAGIYLLIRLLSWQRDKKEAQKINEKLKEFKTDI